MINMIELGIMYSENEEYHVYLAATVKENEISLFQILAENPDDAHKALNKILYDNYPDHHHALTIPVFDMLQVLDIEIGDKSQNDKDWQVFVKRLSTVEIDTIVQDD